jgi:hypothetical protein
VGDVASGAPRGAERTASPPCAVCESQIARGPAKALAGASTVGLLAAAGPAAPGLDPREYQVVGSVAALPRTFTPAHFSYSAMTPAMSRLPKPSACAVSYV